ncbi:MAG TPA: hypothetical protein VIK69_05480, partial [Methylophilaceae bacterium]
NHGKSRWLDQVAVQMSRLHGWKWAVFSPETGNENHIVDLVEIWAGRPFFDGPTPRVSERELRDGLNWIEDRFFFIGTSDHTPNADWIIERARAAVIRHGIRGLIVDPYNEIEASRPAGMTETEFVSQLISKFKQFAKAHDVTVFMVVHPTKLKTETGASKEPVPGLYDLAGCHDEATEVLTKRGWVPHSEVTLEDEVACFDPEKEMMRWGRPSKIWVADYDGEMVRLEARSFDALVTPNHRMVVRPSWRGRYTPIGSGKGRPFAYSRDGWSFKFAEDLASDLEMPWSTPFEAGTDVTEICGMPADDMLRFIGWWVSEGWVQECGLGLCQSVGPLADKMAETMRRLGVDFSEHIGGPGGNGGTLNGWKAYIGVRANRDLVQFIKKNCGSGARNKRLPDVIWECSTRQKEILLDALIEGDGSHKRPGTNSYSTTSRVLADQVQRLAIECGRMASISSSPPVKEGHSEKFQVNIGRKDRGHISLRKARHISRQHYTGKVYCLTVPTGAYLVRRNGKPGIYGNSAHWRNKADAGLVVYRDYEEKKTLVYSKKIRRQPICGQPGVVEFVFLPHDRRFTEISGSYNEMGRKDAA